MKLVGCVLLLTIGLHTFHQNVISFRLKYFTKPAVLSSFHKSYIASNRVSNNHLFMSPASSSSSSSSSSSDNNQQRGGKGGPQGQQGQQGINSRRKMGPPQRKKDTDTYNDAKSGYGRVAVYCVGSNIDIVTLRSHIFRRNFGNNIINNLEAGERPSLSLTRGDAGVPEQIDDEVLHVSNAPLFISTNDTYSKIGASQWTLELESVNNNVNNNLNTMVTTDPDLDGYDLLDSNVNDNNAVISGNNNNNNADEIWKARERLLLATQDIFYFDYGCVVFWGLTPREEKAALNELEGFTIDPVNLDELDNSFDTMQYVFDRKANPQRPIRFDRMRLRSLQIEEKLALSYAMAQSSKLFVFEAKVLQSVERTRYLPKELANKGRIQSSKKELNQLIGQLFVQQTEVNLFSSILDTPDFLWDDDEHLPAYQYTRSYLEVDDRVHLLNTRLGVIRDLLDVLTAQVADNNSTRLEWIVIWLISVEIVMGIWSNPMFTGKRVLSAVLVPTGIWAYKKLDWNHFFSNLD